MFGILINKIIRIFFLDGLLNTQIYIFFRKLKVSSYQFLLEEINLFIRIIYDFITMMPHINNKKSIK